MIDLEETAKKMFEEYAERKLGHSLNWNYLSKERKLMWVNDVFNMYINCINEVQKQIKPHTQPAGAASYERGFVAGQNHEQQFITTSLEAVVKNLYIQFEKAKEEQ